MKKLLLATFGSFAFLLLVNAALFPVFFPAGPPEHYANARPAPAYGWRIGGQGSRTDDAFGPAGIATGA